MDSVFPKRVMLLTVIGLTCVLMALLWSGASRLGASLDAGFESRQCFRQPLDNLAGLMQAFKIVQGRAPDSFTEAREWAKKETDLGLGFEPRCRISSVKYEDKGQMFVVSFVYSGTKIAKDEFTWGDKTMAEGWLYSYRDKHGIKHPD